MDYIYHLSRIMDAIAGWLNGFLPDWLDIIVLGLIGVVGVLAFVVPSLMVLIYIERKLIGRFQIRTGLMRVGPHGVLQPVADAIKVLTKESMTPDKADKTVFNLAPVIALAPALMVWAVLPFAKDLHFTDLNIGILYVVSISTLTIIGAFMAGWSSNNKFALLGAMRTVAQMVSYEVPLVLSLIGVVLVTGSLSLVSIVDRQTVPFLLLQPVGFLIYFISALAELNRAPMDLMEAESEIIAGYHTEYSGFKFAIYYLAEYTHALAMAAMVSSVFLGGWNLFGGWFSGSFIPQYIWFALKVYFIFAVLVWIRATVPRMRVDQLMGFAWKTLLPIALANVFLTGLGILVFPDNDLLLAVFGWLPIPVGLLWLRFKPGAVERGGREAVVRSEYQPTLAK